MQMWKKEEKKRKREEKNPNKTSAKPNIFVQWFYSGNGQASYFNWLWLLAAYNGCFTNICWNDSRVQNQIPESTVLDGQAVNPEASWITSLPIGIIVSFGRKAGVAKMHHRGKKPKLEWYWTLATSCKTCSAFANVLIILQHQALNVGMFTAIYSENSMAL